MPALVSDGGVRSNWDDADEMNDDHAPLLRDDSSTAVHDKYHLVFLIFYLLGLGGLLPWNFFINAQDYWMYKLRECNENSSSSPVTPSTFVSDNVTVISNMMASATTPGTDSTTALQSLFMNSLAVSAMLPSVVFQFLNTVFQERISQNIRIGLSLIMVIVLFIFTVILVKIDTCSWQEPFFIITLVSVVLINSFAAVFQSSVFGLAGELPQKYAGGYMAGQGMGGLFAAVAMIVTLAFSSSASDSAFIFFLVAIAVLILTFFSYILLTKLKFFKHSLVSSQDAASTDADILLDTSDDHSVNYERNFAVKTSPAQEERVTTDYRSLLRIARKLALHLFCVMYVFFVTLACFPAVAGKIKAKTSGTEWTDKYFEPVTCYLVFNFGDWVGRTTASYIHIPSSSSKWQLLTCVIARTAFPILFAFCNYQPRYNLPVVFHEDWMYIVIMVLFAISNGHLSTLSMQYGPKQVEPEYSATAGSMLGFMMSVGLLSGAGFSFLLTSWI